MLQLQHSLELYGESYLYINAHSFVCSKQFDKSCARRSYELTLGLLVDGDDNDRDFIQQSRRIASGMQVQDELPDDIIIEVVVVALINLQW